MEYPDNTPTPPDPIRALAGEDPPEDSDDPPDVVLGEGGTIGRKDVTIRILAPEPDQVFTADGNGLVTLDLHGKVIYRKQSGDRSIVSLPDKYYKWLIDRDPTVVLTGAKGTVEVRLEPGKHDVILRIGDTTQEGSVTIAVAAGTTPAPEPPPSDKGSVSLFQRIINFFRRLFGLK